MSSVKLLFALASFVSLFSLPSYACSYADGYLPATKYDLIKEAHAVLLAQPISKTGYSVDFKILEVLRGDFHGSEFRASEMHSSCIEYSYSIGLEKTVPPHLSGGPPKRVPGKYLLFLKKEKDGWQTSFVAAERMNEIIYDADSSSFLKTVRHLIRVSSTNNYEIEKRELKSLLRLARAGRNPREYPRELIGWIKDHLTSPTPRKSYKDLLELYIHLPNDRKRDALWAMAHGKHAEAANLFTTLLRSPMPADFIGPISEYITQTKNETLLIVLGKSFPELNKNVRWPLMWALIKTAGVQHRVLMLAAIRSADREEAGRLSEWFVRYPDPEATEIVRKFVGNNYQGNSELTFHLAGMGDRGALDWAKGFMKSSDKDRWMAFYTIAHSSLDEADVLARIVIEANNPEELVWLIQGYKDSHNPNRLSRLRDLVDLKTRDREVDYWLKITLEEMGNEGVAGSEELLKILKTRKP